MILERFPADSIKNQEIDLLALQEITCECTLETLAERLNYQYYISQQRTPQKLAILYNPDKIDSVKFNEPAYNALERVAKHGLGRDSRQPIVFDVKARKFDFQFMVSYKSVVVTKSVLMKYQKSSIENGGVWRLRSLFQMHPGSAPICRKSRPYRATPPPFSA